MYGDGGCGDYARSFVKGDGIGGSVRGCVSFGRSVCDIVRRGFRISRRIISFGSVCVRRSISVSRSVCIRFRRGIRLRGGGCVDSTQQPYSDPASGTADTSRTSRTFRGAAAGTPGGVFRTARGAARGAAGGAAAAAGAVLIRREFPIYQQRPACRGGRRDAAL